MAGGAAVNARVRRPDQVHRPPPSHETVQEAAQRESPVRKAILGSRVGGSSGSWEDHRPHPRRADQQIASADVAGGVAEPASPPNVLRVVNLALMS